MSESSKYAALKLDNQLCFPLYAASKEVVRRYKPYLDKVGLTYTQYLAMMALWEESPLSMKELGTKLYLDSGTLTPMLKKMEAHGYVYRKRSSIDERATLVFLTDRGIELRDECLSIPSCLAADLGIDLEEGYELAIALRKLLDLVDRSMGKE